MARRLGGRGAAAGKKPLGDAVLERMEGDDDEPASGLEQALGGGQASGELAKLIVEIEPERLEGARRRVLGLVALAAEHAGDDVGELAGRGDRRFSPRRATMALAIARARRSSPSLPMISASSCSDSVLTRSAAVGPCRAHAHVERAVLHEGEAALGLVELHRGDAEIEHDAGDGADRLRARRCPASR